VIRPVVLMYVRFPMSLRNVEDLSFESGIATATRGSGNVVDALFLGHVHD
jgi:transposase-like protein